MKENPDALTWFSKPELALKQHVNDYKNKKQKEKQVLLDQIQDLKDKVAEHLVLFQESLCSCLDVIDHRFCGNAKAILMRDEQQKQQQTLNVQPDLAMIGETPNPDDEETFRNPLNSAGQSPIKEQELAVNYAPVSEFNIEEPLKIFKITEESAEYNVRSNKYNQKSQT